MKRSKNEPPGSRKFRLTHVLIGIGALYLVFISCKFPHFLRLASMLSGEDSTIRLDGATVGINHNTDSSKQIYKAIYGDAFHRKLEDNHDQDAPSMSNQEPVEEEKVPTRQIRPLQFKYGRITGEIMRRRNRTFELSVLEKLADEAWTLGLKAWEELDNVDENETIDSTVVEGKPESCPSWISVTGEELEKGDGLMFLPCGLAAGSSITVVATPHYAHTEFVPQLARMQRESTVKVSQFKVELQGLKSVDGEDPPKILHLNPRLRGDWSKRPVIEHNTCYRMQWGTAQRCDGLPSKNDDDMLVDGFRRCEKWMRNGIMDTKESKTTSWFKRFIGRKQKPEVTWPFPFIEGRLFILTLRAGVEGYHISVGGRHVTSFSYRPGFTLEDATGLAIKGDVDVHAVYATPLPMTHPSFSQQRVLEMSEPSQGSHSLAFRVMRLCKPSFQVEPPLRLDPTDLLIGEDLLDDLTAASYLPSLLNSATHLSDPEESDLSYRTRLLLHQPTDAMGLSGLLVLPQSFGAIYLGETFCSYISINNSSNFEVREISIKAEIQTERQRILLLDTSKSPVESIRAGGRYDFIVEHDVKELGAHTLVCTALYSDGDGERKYLPQFFKFIVQNPLSVKTKVRVVKEATFLEACIENHTKSNLYMDQVDFEPAQLWSATILRADDHHSLKKHPTREIFKPPVLIRSGGGIYNYLYQLKLSSNGSAQVKVEGSNILGKLQITWRTNLGEPGRLQTQPILGTPITRKDIELQVLEIPSVINLQKPFLIQLKLTNQTDRVLGPFEVWISRTNSIEEKVVMINGLQLTALPQVEAFGSTDLNLNLIATKPGIQRITGITVSDTREKRSYEPLPDLEIFVDMD